jgi:hypothetical protein
MKTMPCCREEEVVAAVIRGNLDGRLSGHVASCESCRTAADVAALLQRDRVSKEIEVRSSNIIWARATLLVRARRRRAQRLGLIVGAVSGALAGYLTSLLLLPSETKLSLDRTAALLSHSPVLLLPAVVIVAAVALIVYSDSRTLAIGRC